MTPRELIDEMFSIVVDAEKARLEMRLIFRLLRDRAYELRLSDGREVSNRTDQKEYCRQVVELLTPPSVTRIPAAPASTCRGLTAARHEQPRWKDTCPKCSHVHEGANECGVDLGGGGKCDCKAQVTA